MVSNQINSSRIIIVSRAFSVLCRISLSPGTNQPEYFSQKTHYTNGKNNLLVEKKTVLN